MPFCGKCGAPLDGGKFCPNCGAKTESTPLVTDDAAAINSPKKTGGKRIFKMAPIHHHFELCGWSETRVVAVFSIITAILCLVAYLGL